MLNADAAEGCRQCESIQQPYPYDIIENKVLPWFKNPGENYGSNAYILWMELPTFRELVPFSEWNTL